jgi:2-keto-4-pentenoate hydratase
MSESTFARLVEALVAARRSGSPISAQGWEAAVPDADAAYRVQDAVAGALGWFGDEAPGHWKSGGPSREAVLTHAALAPSGVRASPADFSDIAFQRRGIEAEIALRLGRAVDAELAASLTPENAAGVVDAMAVTIEVVDSRWADGARESALLRLADAQVHGALAVGDWVPWPGPEQRDWSKQLCRVVIGDEVTERTGSHSLADPAWLLPSWLRHATRHGHVVPAGTVVTTGTWCGVLPAQRGDRVRAEFPGVGSVDVQL